MFKWSPKFETGIDEIDNQHKTLVAKVNELFDKFYVTPDDIADMLDFLAEYAILHFDTEEKYMEKYDYPDPDRSYHLSEHRWFTTEVSKLIEEYKAEGPSEDFEELLKKYLISWLMNHIMNVDRKLAEFLKKKMGEGN